LKSSASKKYNWSFWSKEFLTAMMCYFTNINFRCN
jgi:hypothetical protein